jgi:hypothetical protein
MILGCTIHNDAQVSYDDDEAITNGPYVRTYPMAKWASPTNRAWTIDSPEQVPKEEHPIPNGILGNAQR